MLDKTGVDVKKGIIDPTFYRDDQNRVGTRLIEATDFPTSIEKKDIVLIDDVIYIGGSATGGGGHGSSCRARRGGTRAGSQRRCGRNWAGSWS